MIDFIMSISIIVITEKRKKRKKQGVKTQGVDNE
jgi:hypothetical protein